MNIFRKKSILLFIIIVSLIIFPTIKVKAFEKGIENSTGFGVAELNIRRETSSSSQKLGVIPEGEPFRIISENGNWWKIEYKGINGYVYHPYCMINLPDVEPSIIYNITNAYSCTTRSSGYALPNVTGKKLYAVGKVYNNKIGRNEYIVPVLYSTAKKVSTAQRYANQDGYTLKIYDAYRPTSVSRQLSNSLNILYNNNATVRKNINYSYDANGRSHKWGYNWFLAQSLSTHNTGSAIDVTLAYKSNGKELTMPTVMDECSTKAIKYYAPGTTVYNYTMNQNAKNLDKYCRNAGLNTLASEWWHFQENEGYNRVKKVRGNTGCNFQVYSIVSTTTKASIKWATENKILIGDENGNLNLSGRLCRADAFILLYRIAGEPYVYSSNTGFKDVSSNAYYAKAVIWGKNRNIVKGTGDSMFSPYNACTRGTFVTFLYRYAGSPSTRNTRTYSKISDFNIPTNWALEQGIINQNMANNIDQNITREEAIDILYTYCNKKSTYRSQANSVTYLDEVKKVTIILNTNGGTVSYMKIINEGNRIGKMPTVTRDGYDFLGWYTSKDGGTKINENTIVYRDTIYYAHWKEKEKEKYYVWLVTNGGTVKYYQARRSSGEKIGWMPTPYREGYVFLGWYTSSSGGVKISTDRIITSNQAFYAHWRKK